jgi:hypothetical protein
MWDHRLSFNNSNAIQTLYSIQPATDGGFIIAAGEMFLIKTDSNGRVE